MDFNVIGYFERDVYKEDSIIRYIYNNNLDDSDWDDISFYQELSENFIRNFQNNVNWYYICEYQKLSENFIIEFKNKVDWYFICKYQKISINFIDEMIQDGVIKKKYIEYLLENKSINQEELQRYLSI